MAEEGPRSEAVCLDSVLQKAEELESSLRTWRERLGLAPLLMDTDTDTVEEEARPSTVGGAQPVENVDTTLSGPVGGSVASTSIVRKGGVGVGGGEEGGRVEGAWHQVTSYIVQLEKRLKELEQAGGEATRPAGGCKVSTENKQLLGNACVSPRDEEIGEAEQLVQMDGHSQALLLVFMWLNTAELCIASQVCREWRAVSHHPHLWRTLSLRETVLSSQDISNLGRWCRCTESIILHGLMPEMAGPDEELHSYIARQKGSLEGGLAHLLSAASQLTSLSVTECNLMVTERLLWLCSVHSPLLRHFTYTSDEFPPTPAAIWALSNGCPHLQSLHLPPYLGSPFAGYFNDFSLSSIAKGWPHLLKLSVGGPGITATGLSETVRYCPWLEELCVVCGPQLSSSDVATMTTGGGLTCLRSLSLSFTPISPKALHQLSAACPKLTSFTLHISLNTYFPGTSADSTILNKYHQIRLNFQELQRMPQLKGIFQLQHHPLSTATGI